MPERKNVELFIRIFSGKTLSELYRIDVNITYPILHLVILNFFFTFQIHQITAVEFRLRLGRREIPYFCRSVLLSAVQSLLLFILPT